MKLTSETGLAAVGYAKNLAYAGVATAVLFGMSGKAQAGHIRVYDYSSTPGIGVSELNVKNIFGATEGFDTAYDSYFMSSPYTNVLEIYTEVDDAKLKTDARPIDTPGWDFKLVVKGTVTGDNSLKFKVLDTTDLENKYVRAFDTANPEVVYNIPKDGSIFTILLSDLVNQPAGEYATWRLDLRDYIPGDANLDGTVNYQDAVAIASNWLEQSGADWSMGDFNEDYKVDELDATMLAVNWGRNVFNANGNTCVPEGNMAEYLLVLGGGLAGLEMLRRRKKGIEDNVATRFL